MEDSGMLDHLTFQVLAVDCPRADYRHQTKDCLVRLVVLSATLHDQMSSQERRMVGQLAMIKQVHSGSCSKLTERITR